MRRDRGQFVIRVRRRRAGNRRLHKTLRHEIRIAAVRRRRMRVVVRGETEVTLIIGGPRLVHDVLTGTEQLHDAEREVREAQRIRLPSNGKKVRECLRIRICGKRDAVLCRDDHDAAPALRLAHHAPDGRPLLFREILRDRDVGGDHEILDQVARAILSRDGE